MELYTQGKNLVKGSVVLCLKSLRHAVSPKENTAFQALRAHKVGQNIEEVQEPATFNIQWYQVPG